MSNENYVNVYVEIMTSTLTDAVVRNISLQANAKISEGIIKEQAENLERLESLVNQTTDGQSVEIESLKSNVENHLNTINDLNKRLEDVDKIKNENDSLKNVLNGHLETIGQLNKNLEEVVSVKSDNDRLNGIINSHLETIGQLNKNLEEYNNIKPKYESLKSEHEKVSQQANHVDTFRNELVKERQEHQATRTDFANQINDLQTKHSDEISILKDEIEYLQLTPAKRKKIDEIKSTVVDINNSSKSTKKIEDGGSF
jgi:DNA repair exonuclease SbcCD ATPase subunit